MGESKIRVPNKTWGSDDILLVHPRLTIWVTIAKWAMTFESVQLRDTVSPVVTRVPQTWMCTILKINPRHSTSHYPEWSFINDKLQWPQKMWNNKYVGQQPLEKECGSSSINNFVVRQINHLNPSACQVRSF